MQNVYLQVYEKSPQKIAIAHNVIRSAVKLSDDTQTLRTNLSRLKAAAVKCKY